MNANANHASSQGVLSATHNNQQAANPLDQLSSANIASTVANMTNLTEKAGVANQAQSVNAELNTAVATNDVSSKPQVVATAFKSNKDIQSYIVQPGDTIASIAAKFNVTSNSIKWSNNLGGTVTAGTKILVPPAGVSGIIYTVKSGDTPASLATRYQADENQIIAYNDAELTGLHVGERIIIPNGQQPAVVTYSYFTALYGGNGYDYGFCTWYVATKISVPNNWGNASTWAYYARMSGWTVSSTPVVGAIAQTPYAAGGEGHVAIIEAVSPDHTQIKYSDMNGLAGWGRVGYSDWVSATRFPNYIYH